MYNGKQYSSCTTDGHKLKEWCATTARYDKDRKYGFCHETCVQDKLVYMKGEKWIKWDEKNQGRKMNCECIGNGNSEWSCEYVDMCQ